MQACRLRVIGGEVDGFKCEIAMPMGPGSGLPICRVPVYVWSCDGKWRAVCGDNPNNNPPGYMLGLGGSPMVAVCNLGRLLAEAMPVPPGPELPPDASA